MNDTAFKSCSSFLIGVALYHQTAYPEFIKETLRYARRQYLNRIAAAQSSQRETLIARVNLHY